MKKLLLLFTVLVMTVALSACKNQEDTEPKYDIPDEQVTQLYDLPYYEYVALNNPRITIKVKDMGDMVIELFPDVAPNTVANFITNIESGVYEENEFHRVVVNFMIQGGRVTNPPCTIQGEMNANPEFEGVNDLVHYRGVISMARVGFDFDSAHTQFFVVHENSVFLDEQYAGFGGVVEGFNILDFIANMNDGTNELPYETVIIEDITVDYRGYVLPEPVCVG